MLDEEKTIVTEPVVSAEIPEVQADTEVVEPIANEESPSVPHVKKKKKWPLILAIIGVVVAIVIVAVLALGNPGSSSPSKVEPIAISARMTDDGTAYIPLFDGTSITINEEVQSAVLTKDRKHIVVLLKDGLLYITDGQLANKTTIADNVTTFIVRNDGILYEDDENVLYRVMFADYANVKIGEDVAFVVATDTTSVLYATGEGKVYTMAATTSEATKVGTFENRAELEAISNDGQISIWVDKDSSDLTIYLSEGDSRTTLGQVDSKYNYTYATFTDDQKIIVVTNSYCNRMWIKSVGSDPVEVKLAGEPQNHTVYTANGNLSDEISTNVQSLYFSTESDSGNNLYNITLSGDRERVLSKINTFTISNGYIIFTDTESNLFYGKLNGTEVLDEEKIASEVSIFEVTENGKYVYYTKDYDDEVATLYCYKLGEDSPVKIASEVACYGGWSYGWTYNAYSTDGATVFYFKDLEEVEDTYSDHGTLLMWTYGDESSQKIASEVLTYSITSGLSSGEVKKNSLMFLKYSSVDTDENIYTNWMYYNGTDTTKIAADVIK